MTFGRKSDDARKRDAFTVQLYEVLACQNEDRKGTKSSKLPSQATADHYVDSLKSFKSIKPGEKQNCTYK
jgi:hypothetical protein